ncbi:TonB-dependent receptor [Roseivirga echinicomitans]
MENYSTILKALFQSGLISRIQRLIFLLAFLGIAVFAKSQTGLILLDPNNEAIEGALVYVLGTSQVKVSDQRGMVILEISENSKVNITHVGFKATEVMVTVDSWQNLTLTPITTNLQNVQVEGFLENRDLNEQAGAISTISLKTLKQFDRSSLVQAVNSVPGIRFEERAGASYRISIRGSSVRSPFGVRNVKVYWNDIPFTEPGGNTFINLLDLTNISGIEIIKGPASSIYGAGTGGVIKLKSTVPGDLNNTIQASGTIGSYGLKKSDLIFNQLSSKNSLTVKASIQKSDGYREHNAMDRRNLEMDALFFPNNKQTISLSMLYSNLFYEIPGALNPLQRKENRRQSRPGSIDKNASIDNQYWLMKIGQELEWGKAWKGKVSFFGSKMDFENPFNLDYKRDEQDIFGGRMEVNRDVILAGKPASFVVGAEFQKSSFLGKNFGNVMGQADTINFEDDIASKQSIVFGSFQIEPMTDLFVTAGLSRNAMNYDINRLVDKVNNNPTQFNKEFETVWSPRLGISKKLNKDLSVHFSVSQGFSPPTTTEVRTNEGSINRSIQPEKGTNYEWNVRGNLMDNRLSFDMAIFRFDLKESISSYTNNDGVVLFRNAGKNTQQGLEIQLLGEWIKDEEQPLRNLSTSLSYTLHAFEYENYVNNNNDFSGNALPGTAKNVLALQVNASFIYDLDVNLSYQYSDAIPLNDANTVYSRPYNLWNINYSYDIPKKKKTQWELFGGVNNIFDVDYSLGNDLNAFGNRYFQPAPGRNYFMGVRLILLY